ncbi:hypothetical protein ABW19_dt0210175 [Dactylella cylindrospora]|nr:hypothetical protein ABW19_dt0210175 [Dactylella cylindrospora]
MRTKPPSANTTPPSSTTSNRPVKRRKTLSDTSNIPTELLNSPIDVDRPENAGHSSLQHVRNASLEGTPNIATTATFSGTGPTAAAIQNGYGNFQNSPTESYGTDGARSPINYGSGDLTTVEMEVDTSHFGGESSTLTSPTTNSKVNITNAEKHVTKRACNECRQQKQDKIAEMEKEVAYLRSLLGMSSTTSSPVVPQPTQFSPTGQISQPLLEASASAISSFAASQPLSNGLNAFGSQAANSNPDMELTSLLTDLSRRGASKPTVDVAPPKDSQTLEDVMLTKEQIDELFQIFFEFYHPFLPMLDPSTTPSTYYTSSQLLFWVVVSIASRRYPSGEPNLLIRLSRAVSKLVWSTLATVPHSKHVVKALILLSTWPFPTSSTLTDPTYMLSGLAVSVAIQMGLHRPGYGKDYTKYASKAKFDNMEVSDRMITWACCNISAQSVSTGLGLPPDTQYDWTICNALLPTAKHPLPTPLRNLVLIQRFIDNVTRSLSSNNNDPIGLLDRDGRLAVITLLERRLDELEGELSPTLTQLHRIYLLCARLHLRSFYLFDSPSTQACINRIIQLYHAAEALVTHILKTEEDHVSILDYCPVYIWQMFTSAAFTMLKVLRSNYFNRYLEVEPGIKGFNAALNALRSISVADNDLPGRMSDVLTQLWECGGLGPDRISIAGGSVDGSISAAVSAADVKEESVAGGMEGEATTVHPGWDLRIRSRMSMSVVYDSLWKWREQFRERSAYLQTREEVGGAVDKSQSQSLPPQSQTQSQTPQPPTLQPSQASQQSQQQQQQQQQQQTPSQQNLSVSQRASFPVLSNAFQRPSTPLIPTDLLSLSTPTPGSRPQNPMLPIPTTSSNSGTPSNASAAGLDADVQMFVSGIGLGGSGIGAGGLDANFDLNWVLDGFEFLGEADGSGGVDGLGAEGVFGVPM